MQEFLIWSEEHGAWWAPVSVGYTTSIVKAGRYTEPVAKKICRGANYGSTFHEIAIPVPQGIPARKGPAS